MRTRILQELRMPPKIIAEAARLSRVLTITPMTEPAAIIAEIEEIGKIGGNYADPGIALVQR